MDLVIVCWKPKFGTPKMIFHQDMPTDVIAKQDNRLDVLPCFAALYSVSSFRTCESLFEVDCPVTSTTCFRFASEDPWSLRI